MLKRVLTLCLSKQQVGSANREAPGKPGGRCPADMGNRQK